MLYHESSSTSCNPEFFTGLFYDYYHYYSSFVISNKPGTNRLVQRYCPNLRARTTTSRKGDKGTLAFECHLHEQLLFAPQRSTSIAFLSFTRAALERIAQYPRSHRNVPPGQPRAVHYYRQAHANSLISGRCYILSPLLSTPYYQRFLLCLLCLGLQPRPTPGA